MIIGVDYSISNPSVCILTEDQTFVHSKFFFLTSVKKNAWNTQNIHGELHKDWITQEERFDHISNACIGFISTQVATHPQEEISVYIEDYAFAAKGKVFNIGEATGLFKHKVHRLPGVKLFTVGPKVIKKFATESGNAKKDQMYHSLIKLQPTVTHCLKYWITSETSIEKSPIADIVDSYWIARYGASQQTH